MHDVSGGVGLEEQNSGADSRAFCFRDKKEAEDEGNDVERSLFRY